MYTRCYLVPSKAVTLLWLVGTSACAREQAPPPSASRVEAAAPVESVSAPAPASGVQHFRVSATGTASFLIDAPLEKIKGSAGLLRGTLDIDPTQLSATTGHVEVDLGDLRTSTFDDPGKNAKQTEHAHNWFEIGTDVEPKAREENRWARFRIRRTTSAVPTRLSDASPKDGWRTVAVTVEGDLTVHGVTAPKTVTLRVGFEGSPAAPTALRAETTGPFVVSLKEHDVKPRDAAGKFLLGALEKVGKKLDDSAQVALVFRAEAASR